MLRVPWHVAVFDEAHKLKNRNAKIHEACCQLDTKLRYGLTGTAMQVPTFTSCFYIMLLHQNTVRFNTTARIENMQIQRKMFLSVDHLSA